MCKDKNKVFDLSSGKVLHRFILERRSEEHYFDGLTKHHSEEFTIKQQGWIRAILDLKKVVPKFEPFLKNHSQFVESHSGILEGFKSTIWHYLGSFVGTLITLLIMGILMCTL